MTNELAKTDRNAAYVARYNAPSVNPYAAFANEGGPGIVGKHLTNTKGDWGIGEDKAEVPPDTRYLMIVPEALRGWVRFGEHGITDADVGLIRDNFQVKHRYALGDADESQWPTLNGQPKDPWTRYVSVLLIEVSPPHNDVTFTSGSLAIKEMCRIYGAEAHLHPDSFPVVELTTRNRPHKQYGSIKGPWFDVVGWATVEDIRKGRKTTKVAKAPTPPAPPTPAAAELDDALPDWG